MTDLPVKHLEERMDKIEWKLDKILERFDGLSNTYVTRREYEASKEANKWTSGTWQMIILLIIAVAGVVMNLLK